MQFYTPDELARELQKHIVESKLLQRQSNKYSRTGFASKLTVSDVQSLANLAIANTLRSYKSWMLRSNKAELLKKVGGNKVVPIGVGKKIKKINEELLTLPQIGEDIDFSTLGFVIGYFIKSLKREVYSEFDKYANRSLREETFGWSEIMELNEDRIANSDQFERVSCDEVLTLIEGNAELLETHNKHGKERSTALPIREIIQLKTQGYTYQEIGEILGINAVYARSIYSVSIKEIKMASGY